MSKQVFIIMLSLLVLSCGSPKSYLDRVVKDQNFIPYQLPMESTRVGTILKGNDREMYLVARPERCFPDLDGDKALRWTQAIELPNEYKRVEIKFNGEANAALQGGNSVVQFKTSAHFVKTINIEFEDASIEFLNEWSFQDFWDQGMSFRCQKALGDYQFIGQGLRVGKMRFEFKNEYGVNIDLTAELSKVVDIEMGVSWKVENKYTLIINTPKYIGYRMAKIFEEDGFVELKYASKVSTDGSWIFKSLVSKVLSTLRKSQPAEPLR